MHSDLAPEAPFQQQLSEASGVLANRSFLYLWMAQALSQTSLNATVYVLLVRVEEWTQSSIALGLLILSFIVPSVVMGAAAGAFVDRWEKQRVLFVTNLLRALIMASFAIVPQAFVPALTLNLAYSVVSQFFAPAELAAIPQVVPRPQLIVANGLFNLTMTGAQLAGFVLVGPVLVKSIEGPLVFVLLGMVYAVCAFLIWLMKMEEPARPRDPVGLNLRLVQDVFRELKEGWSMLVRDARVSLAVFHLTLMNSLILVVGMLAPGYVSRVIGIRADDAVFVMAPAGVGMLIGISVLPRITRHWSKELVSNFGIFVNAAVLFSLAGVGAIGPFLVSQRFLAEIGPLQLPEASGAVLIVMLLALILGFGFSLVNVAAQTIVQEQVPVDLRGRIFATQLAVANAAAVAPLLFFGSLAEIVGINRVSVVTATVVLSAGLFSVIQGRKTAAEHGKA